MASKHPFKLIIVGGGVAGLTLANMLEKFNIDYVLLESHAEIAPPVGASIGLMPHGLLVLDQIECYEAIKKVAQVDDITTIHMCDQDGKSVASTQNVMGHLEKRYGWPLLFFDRQWLLQVLYDEIKQKDKVLLNSKVQEIIPLEQGVKVKTTNGEIHFGSMVVGADGIHSTVRSEMRRIADQMKPGYFPSGEEDRVPCYYRCCFGISHDVEGWRQGDLCYTAGQGRSSLTISGPNGRCYWFLFVRLPEVKYGKDIPKYTKKDEEQFVKEHADMSITERVKFRQIYDKRSTSTLTPLHEVVYEKWHFDRVILIGDSAHKPNPIGGMGGNAAIESAAELVNALLEAADGKKPAGGLDSLSASDLDGVFRTVQSERFERSKFVVSAAHEQQAVFASENPLVSLLALRLLIPLRGNEPTHDTLGARIVNGSRLRRLPVPHRPHVNPYDCELPARPLTSPLAQAPRVLLVAGAGLVLAVTAKAFRIPLGEIGSWAGLAPLDRSWLGRGGLNRMLVQLTSAISYLTLSPDPAVRVHMMYFLSQLVSPLLVYTVEGYRVGNRASLLSLPSLFTAGMQLQGIGRAAPVYAILSSLSPHEDPADRVVRPEVAKALLPALVLGYVVPTVMLFAPLGSTRSRQNWTALWQFAPPLFSALTAAISHGLRLLKRPAAAAAAAAPKPEPEPRAGAGPKPKPDQKRDPGVVERYSDADVPILRTVYTFAFAAQAAAHLATLAYARSYPLPLARVFLSLPSPLRRDWALPSVAAQLSVFIRYDMAAAFAASAMHNLYSVWNLRRQGYITSFSAARAAAAVALGQVLVGPGATWAGLWSWREGVIAGLATR